MAHQHIYNSEGKQICCTEEEKVYTNADAQNLLEQNSGSAHNDHDHSHSHDHNGSMFRMFLPPIFSAIVLLLALSFDNWWIQNWFHGRARIALYVLAYIPVGFPVMKEALESIRKGQFFSEFLLMCIATIGAFAIKSYPEAVAVMLFYTIGEVFQTLAVKKAKNNIQKLLDQRPDEVTIIDNKQSRVIKASDAQIDDIIQMKPGEKVALDGILISESATFNTTALTGESIPDHKEKGEVVWAGMINLNGIALVKVTTAYADSKLSKILELVQNAAQQKAPTELFIRKFAKVYTPIVVFLAACICLLPFLFVADYSFKDWLYKALVFLVISCPCALVISIPLGYFGGIGAASRNGILFKGSNFLDILSSIKNVVMDKTGTLTEGVFNVQQVHIEPDFDENEMLQIVNSLEAMSTHPVATAIHNYVGAPDPNLSFLNMEEIPGHGLKAEIHQKVFLAGNSRLLDRMKVSYPTEILNSAQTVIILAYGGKYAGYLLIADAIKADAAEAIRQLKALGITTTMLSGDKSAVVAEVAGKLEISHAYGELLPEDKVNKIKEIKREVPIAFVGDGVNDAPVVAQSDVGIAMGGLGSDATIEIADVVIQDDLPTKIPMAIRISRKTRSIVWQNISLAFIVKVIVLILGAGGLATMWEAVFADVGVALLAILNAVRIQKMKFASS